MIGRPALYTEDAIEEIVRDVARDLGDLSDSKQIMMILTNPNANKSSMLKQLEFWKRLRSVHFDPLICLFAPFYDSASLYFRAILVNRESTIYRCFLVPNVNMPINMGKNGEISGVSFPSPLSNSLSGLYFVYVYVIHIYIFKLLHMT